jgi:hypothetical protein
MTRVTIDRQWRLFAHLVRLSFGRLMDAALGSREVAAEHFVIWGGALLATPTLLYTVRAVSWYPFLRVQSLELLQQEALRDRLFFIIWAMLAATLLVSLVWEGLFPDRTDQQILGVLPVGHRLAAASRLAASLSIGLGLIAAINGPTAIIYGLTGGAHPVLGSRVAIAGGQLAATVMAGLFTFSTLLALRGLLVFVVGAAAAARVAVVLQIATVLLLVESFLFLPGLLPALLHHLLVPGVPGTTWIAPAWFLGLSIEVGGPRAEVLAVMAPTALAATLLTLVAAGIVYVVPAPWTARRAIEARAADHRGRLGRWLVEAASRSVVGGPARAMVAFTLRSLARSPRHQFVVASWIGLALAVCSVQLIAAAIRGRPLPFDAPFEYLVALPLVMTFFLTGGLRTAFSLPTDARANWTFRVTATGARGPCLNAVRATLWLLAVAPVSVLIVAVGGWLWGLERAMTVGAMHLVTGLLLCEISIVDCESIPFTRDRGLSTSSLKVGVPMAVLGLISYAFLLDGVQVWALSSASRVTGYVVTVLTVTVAIRVAGHGRARQPIPSFDAPTEEMTTLRLSGAGG